MAGTNIVREAQRRICARVVLAASTQAQVPSETDQVGQQVKTGGRQGLHAKDHFQSRYEQQGGKVAGLSTAGSRHSCQGSRSAASEPGFPRAECRALTEMPTDLRWCAFLSSLTLPEAASSALEGTQPRFTQVPPMSCPSTMPTLRPCKWCGDACQALCQRSCRLKSGFVEL